VTRLGRSGDAVGCRRPWVMVEDRRLARNEGSEDIMIVSRCHRLNIMVGERSRAAQTKDIRK
jgi:hypothetical protein